MSSSLANGEDNHSNGRVSNQQRWLPRDFYPAPPPPRPPSRCRYTAAHRSSSTVASVKGCCCCLLLLLTFISLLVAAVALVIALVVKPKKPHFDLQQVAVSYLLLTTPTAGGGGGGSSAAYLTLNLTMLFTAENPNRVGIKYGPSSFTVMYHGVALGVAEIPGFDQPARSTRLVQASVVVDRVDILQTDAVQLVRDASVSDRVELNVAGDVGAKIRFLGITSPRVQVSVGCAIVISPRRQSVTEKQCGVTGLNV
ncbi:unnamed protein product [Spirodela intermedia]|uniref:Late embryogenesis abundant protein LEA-2 subgroup domain-containing protein n=1 Tax=Spirodela intermedia TaxID=51605 RepID=A0A7I8KX85_SPIIN|nr:unnamed protein product [Spirodela intermedia]